MRSLILNGNNVVENSFNDTYKYNFPVGSVSFKDDQVAIASVNMYYSWFNITSGNTGSRYNNNVFQYVWHGSAGSTTHTVVIPDGYYGVGGLNAYLQSAMVENGHYLVDGDGNFVYYIELVENPTYYSVQLNVYAFPSSLPTGFSNPTGRTFPSTPRTPQIVVLATNTFKDVLGFTPGTYPEAPSTTNFTKLSDYTPQVSPVSSLIITCSLLNNSYAIPSTLLSTFTPAGTAFGDLISFQPTELSFVDIQDGSYTDLTIEFRDQNLNRVAIRDKNLIILLVVRNKFENSR